MKIKVCGMRECENIQELVKLPPDYIGFIFYNKSKRYVSDFPKLEIPSAIKKVGVFVNESIENIVELVTENKLDVVQLHGNESTEFCKELNHLVTEQSQSNKEIKENVISTPLNHQVQIIKAFSVDENFDFSTTKAYEQFCNLFIFDTKGKGYGGTGLKYDWSILKNYKEETPFLLSGGIGFNDAGMVNEFKHPKCVGVDLNSGFEEEPGIKNIEKLNAFKKQLNV